MFHSDLQQEIALLQAQLDYKRRKLTEGLRNKTPLKDMEGLHNEIRTVEQKLQFCFEESNTQMEGQ